MMYIPQNSLIPLGPQNSQSCHPFESWVPYNTFGKHVIEAKMIAGKNVGLKVLIAWMALTPSDVTKFPIRFQRRQFPISVCYAMTIYKSQRQSLAHVGLYLPSLVFSHGQLYVVFSRVTSKKDLKVLIWTKKENQPIQQPHFLQGDFM